MTDSGEGIRPEIQEHIFDPFYTTKDHGNGAGLGLSVVYGIVKDAGGEIAVRSLPGEGACFEILLPCYSESQSSVSDPLPGAAQTGDDLRSPTSNAEFLAKPFSLPDLLERVRMLAA